MISSKILDGGGNGTNAFVTKFGQLVVAPVDYSAPVSNELGVINTAVNFIVPVMGQRIVITDILLYANRNVGVNDATVEIYEANAPDTTDVFRSIITTEMVKQSSRDLIGLNLITTAGKWINAKTNDDDVFVTIMHYYVPAAVS